MLHQALFAHSSTASEHTNYQSDYGVAPILQQPAVSINCGPTFDLDYISHYIESTIQSGWWRSGLPVDLDLRCIKKSVPEQKLILLALYWGSWDDELGPGHWRFLVATRLQARLAKRLTELLARGIQASCEITRMPKLSADRDCAIPEPVSM